MESLVLDLFLRALFQVLFFLLCTVSALISSHIASLQYLRWGILICLPPGPLFWAPCCACNTLVHISFGMLYRHFKLNGPKSKLIIIFPCFSPLFPISMTGTKISLPTYPNQKFKNCLWPSPPTSCISYHNQPNENSLFINSPVTTVSQLYY